MEHVRAGKGLPSINAGNGMAHDGTVNKCRKRQRARQRHREQTWKTVSFQAAPPSTKLKTASCQTGPPSTNLDNGSVPGRATVNKPGKRHPAGSHRRQQTWKTASCPAGPPSTNLDNGSVPGRAAVPKRLFRRGTVRRTRAAHHPGDRKRVGPLAVTDKAACMSVSLAGRAPKNAARRLSAGTSVRGPSLTSCRKCQGAFTGGPGLVREQAAPFGRDKRGIARPGLGAGGVGPAGGNDQGRVDAKVLR
jgi:hypothetical protein